jgi:hypothetical protein
VSEKAFPSIAAAARAYDLNPDWLRTHLDFVTHTRICRRVWIEPEDLEQYLSTFVVLPASAMAVAGNSDRRAK